MRQYLIKHTISDISCEKYYPIRKQYKLKKSGFPIVRQANSAPYEIRRFWLFPYPAIGKCQIAKEIAKKFFKKVVMCLLQRTP